MAHAALDLVDEAKWQSGNLLVETIGSSHIRMWCLARGPLGTTPLGASNSYTSLAPGEFYVAF